MSWLTNHLMPQQSRVIQVVFCFAGSLNRHLVVWSLGFAVGAQLVLEVALKLHSSFVEKMECSLDLERSHPSLTLMPVGVVVFSALPLATQRLSRKFCLEARFEDSLLGVQFLQLHWSCFFFVFTIVQSSFLGAGHLLFQWFECVSYSLLPPNLPYSTPQQHSKSSRSQAANDTLISYNRQFVNSKTVLKTTKSHQFANIACFLSTCWINLEPLLSLLHPAELAFWVRFYHFKFLPLFVN